MIPFEPKLILMLYVSVTQLWQVKIDITPIYPIPVNIMKNKHHDGYINERGGIL